ncbi:MAG: phage tail sheath C-terminal domain-containing protein, partial [Bacteroidota bacterium]
QIVSPPIITNKFNLTIYQKNTEGRDVKVEEHLNVTLDEGETRYLPKVLKQNSVLIEVPEISIGSGEWLVKSGSLNATPLDPISSPPEPSDGLPMPQALTGGLDGGDIDSNEYIGSDADQTGLYALKQADLFNLLCIPPPKRRSNTPNNVYQTALTICNEKRAILLVDPPMEWGTIASEAVSKAKNGLAGLGLSGSAARNAAIYLPRIEQPDPLRGNQIDTFVPCGVIAGAIAKNDTARGIWKAPAGIDVGLNGISGLQVNLSDPENGLLNPLGINCLRSFPTIGRVIWGARTLRGADILADEYKYLSVRRMLLFMQESLYRGLKWVVFEPNDEPLWSQIRLNVGAFMHNLYRQGAFQGKKKEAYFVKCDSETTNQADINAGIVNVVVGFAPLKPAEFVIITFQQMAGQIDT